MSRYFQNLNILNDLTSNSISCDNLSVNNSVSSSLIPSSNLINLGSTSDPWDQSYCNNLNLISASGTNLILSNLGTGELSVTSPSGTFFIGPSGTVTTSSFTQVAYGTNTTISSGDLIFDSYVATGTIPYNVSNGVFSLSAGKVYRISVGLSCTLTNNTYFEFAVCQADNTQLSKRFQAISINAAFQNGNTGSAEFIYAPSVDTNIKIRIFNDFGAGNINFFGSFYSGCLVQQI